MENLLHQTISEEEIDSLTKEIRNLTPEELDKLFNAIGFKVSTGPGAEKPGEGQFKAITFQIIDNVKQSFDSARTVVVSLVFESDIEILKKTLIEILQSRST
jgi:hypothetical protein